MKYLLVYVCFTLVLCVYGKDSKLKTNVPDKLPLGNEVNFIEGKDGSTEKLGVAKASTLQASIKKPVSRNTNVSESSTKRREVKKIADEDSNEKEIEDLYKDNLDYKVDSDEVESTASTASPTTLHVNQTALKTKLEEKLNRFSGDKSGISPEKGKTVRFSPSVKTMRSIAGQSMNTFTFINSILSIMPFLLLN